MSTRRKINKILKDKGLVAEVVYDGSGASRDDYGWWTITFDQQSADFLTSQDFSDVIEISDLDAGFEELAELPKRLIEENIKIKVRYLSCGSDSNLLAKGIHSADNIIAAAIACGEIDEEFAQEFKGNPVSGWWHAVPCPDGGCEYHGSKEGVRGAFLGTFVPMGNY